MKYSDMSKGMGELLRRYNHETRVLTDEAIKRVLRLINEYPWTDPDLEEAARGAANGLCIEDAPEVQFAFNVALAENLAERHGITKEQARAEVVELAMRGYFNAK